MENTKLNNLGTYPGFLEGVLGAGYDCRFFTELSGLPGELTLRHDIDFDTGFALQTAIIESRYQLKASYFFLLRSDFYNIFSPRDYENVCRIRDLGHCISIHFDPVIYEDFHEGLKQEIQVFHQHFGARVDIISLHRPNDFFLKYDTPILGIEHTYQTRYFRDMKYFSDSTGVWRFGHPFQSPEFLEKQPLHILTHPIWWMVDGASNHDKLRLYFFQRVQNLKTGFFNNCIPFRDIYESL